MTEARRIMGSSSNSEWSSLPVDILLFILDHLVPMRDYLGFSEVCSQWKHAVCKQLEDLRCNRRRHCRLHQKLPLVLVSFRIGTFCLYDVVQGKCVWEFQMKQGDWRFEGCSHGWLILLHLRTHEVRLYNPFSGKSIHLPPIGGKSIPDFSAAYEKKCVLSADPDHNSDFVIVMMSRDSERRAAFFRSGDENWTYVKNLKCLEDIACVDRIFYLLEWQNVVFSWDGFELRWIPSRVDRRSLDRYFTESRLDRFFRDEYLVESPEGDLLRVEKTKTGFLLYKLVWFSRNSRWEEVESLGDVALFLGHNNSISVMASDFPGCRPNSVYFFSQSNKYPSPLDRKVYVFSLNDRTFTRLCPHILRPVLWISPNLV